MDPKGTLSVVFSAMHSVKIHYTTIMKAFFRKKWDPPEEIAFKDGIAKRTDDDYNINITVYDPNIMIDGTDFRHRIITHMTTHIAFLRPTADPETCLRLRQEWATQKLEDPGLEPLPESDDVLLVRHLTGEKLLKSISFWFVDELPQLLEQFVEEKKAAMTYYLKPGRLFARAWKMGTDDHLADWCVRGKNTRTVHVSTPIPGEGKVYPLVYCNGVMIANSGDVDEIRFQGTTCMAPWREIPVSD